MARTPSPVVAGPTHHSLHSPQSSPPTLPPRRSPRLPAVSMEMDGSGGIPPTQPPPPDDAAAALALTKRARKRSRFLSPPYTDTDVQEEGEREGVAVAGEREEGPPPDVSATATLSALLAVAPSPGQGVDSAALGFLKLHRRNRNTAVAGSSDDGGSKKPPSPGGGGGGGGGHTKLDLSAGPAMPPGPVDGSPGLAKKKKNPDADGPMQDAAAPGQAQAAGFAANGTYAAANHAPPPERKKKYKKRAKSHGPPPLPKLTLTDIRSNLEMMIGSLTATAELAASSPDNLVREMQGLLAKVDRSLQGRSATAAHHH